MLRPILHYSDSSSVLIKRILKIFRFFVTYIVLKILGNNSAERLIANINRMCHQSWRFTGKTLKIQKAGFIFFCSVFNCI